MPVAIITGASEGFGRALAEDLAEEGWRLVIDGRDADRLTLAADAIRNLGATVDAIVGDVTDEAHRADLVVNNASTLGPSPLPPLLSYPLAAYEDVLRTNVVAPLALLQLTLPALTASKGTIVDISSDAAVEGYEGWGGYGSAKAALDQVTRVLAAEHPDLRVYSFDPGDMRTRMHQDAFPGEDISDRPLPATVVPALRRLLREAPPSGRYRAVDLLVAEP